MFKPVAWATQSGEQWANSESRESVIWERQGGARMAGKNWQIEGRYIEYCSCDHGCPCETMADPTYGDCTGLVAFKIDKGHARMCRSMTWPSSAPSISRGHSITAKAYSNRSSTSAPMRRSATRCSTYS